jgi:amino acid transporter
MSSGGLYPGCAPCKGQKSPLHRAYIGYSDANYALSEVRDPIRTIKRAAPFAVLLVTLAYVAVNLAYFAVVSKQDMLEGGTTAAYGLYITQAHAHADKRFL